MLLLESGREETSSQNLQMQLILIYIWHLVQPSSEMAGYPILKRAPNPATGTEEKLAIRPGAGRSNGEYKFDKALSLQAISTTFSTRQYVTRNTGWAFPYSLYFRIRRGGVLAAAEYCSRFFKCPTGKKCNFEMQSKSQALNLICA